MLVRARPFLNAKDVVQVMSSEAGEDDIFKFENEFAKKIGAPRAYAIHQGRDALMLALTVIGIKPGDEIIVPNFICSVVIDSILFVGAVPVLIDNSIGEFNSPVENYENALTPKTKAMLALHLYGIPAKMDQLKQLAEKNRCWLLEDCAQTIASKFQNQNVGTFGQISFFSFNFDKPMSLGQGGMLVVNDQSLVDITKTVFEKNHRISQNAERMILRSLLLQHYLTSEERYNNFLPITFAADVINLFPGVTRRIDKFIESGDEKKMASIVAQIRPMKLLAKIAKRVPTPQKTSDHKFAMSMNGLRAKLGLLQLKHWDIVEERKRQNSQAYEQIFNGIITFKAPPALQSFFTVFSRFTVLMPEKSKRETLISKAKKMGLELDHSNWKKTILAHSDYRNKVKMGGKSLQTSEDFAARILHFPTHYYVTADHLNRVNTLVNEG